MMISKKLNEHLKSIFKPVFAIFSQTGGALTGFGAEEKILQHFMKIVYTTILELTNEDFCREYFKLFSQVARLAQFQGDVLLTETCSRDFAQFLSFIYLSILESRIFVGKDIASLGSDRRFRRAPQFR